jgi:hypothetical protein
VGLENNVLRPGVGIVTLNGPRGQECHFLIVEIAKEYHEKKGMRSQAMRVHQKGARLSIPADHDDGIRLSFSV